MISNCGHDERGKYSGGIAGDQTKDEYINIPWYNRPWKCVLRFPNRVVSNGIAMLARHAADNDKIGYDQGQRLTFYNELSKVGWNPKLITVPCEADCSSSSAALIIAAGHVFNVGKLQVINPSMTTSNMRGSLVAIGFDLLTDQKYLTSDKYLLPGDLLLNDGHHVAINLDMGTLAKVEDDRFGVDINKPKEYLLGWNKDESGWWYANSATTYIKNKWEKINNKWYYFDGSGIAYQNKWLFNTEDQRWYYFDENCFMVTGFRIINNTPYYFNEDGAVYDGEITITFNTDKDSVLQFKELK